MPTDLKPTIADYDLDLRNSLTWLSTLAPSRTRMIAEAAIRRAIAAEERLARLEGRVPATIPMPPPKTYQPYLPIARGEG